MRVVSVSSVVLVLSVRPDSDGVIVDGRRKSSVKTMQDEDGWLSCWVACFMVFKRGQVRGQGATTRKVLATRWVWKLGWVCCRMWMALVHACFVVYRRVKRLAVLCVTYCIGMRVAPVMLVMLVFGGSWT